MAKDIQIEVNRRGLAFDKEIGKHHRNVAEAISEPRTWEEYALEEIEQIRQRITGE